MDEVVLKLAKTAGKGVLHSITRALSVVAVVGIGWAIYAGIIRPVTKPQTTESYSQIVAEGGTNINIEIENPDDSFFLGLKLWGFKFGISKPKVKKMAETIKEAKKIK